MLIVNWKHVLLKGAFGGHRVKRPGPGGGGPAIFASATDQGVLSGGKEHWTHKAPASITDPADEKKYLFAFWSRKASPLPDLFDPIIADRNVDTQANPNVTTVVDATAWYIWDFGAGGGDNGVFFDAFDIDLNDFIGDDFVDLTPDDVQKHRTKAANETGMVDTSLLPPGTEFTVKARQVLPGDTEKRFENWLQIDAFTFSAGKPEPTVQGDKIVAHTNDIVVAVAYYNEDKLSPCRELEKELSQIIADLVKTQKDLRRVGITADEKQRDYALIRELFVQFGVVNLAILECYQRNR